MRKEYERLQKLNQDLTNAHVNNITLKYNIDPVFVLSTICLTMFDKLNECVERINYLERQINAKNT